MAYEVLSDDTKRRIYDQHGEEGLEGASEGGRGGGGGGADLFSSMFGSGGLRQQRKDLQVPLNLSLDLLYSGTTKKMKVNRNIICDGCDGRGGARNSAKTCHGCNGQGKRVQTIRMGPVIQQSTSRCDECKGKGTYYENKDICGTCKGRTTVQEPKILEVYIAPGTVHDHQIKFTGEADQSPGEPAGDVVFIIQELQHDTFQRKREHLHIKREISLYEALTGVTFYLKHLDGRILEVKGGAIINPNDVKCIKGEGMPKMKNRLVKGNLYVHFDVKFPKKPLSPTECKALATCLPQPQRSIPSGEIDDMDRYVLTTPEHPDQDDEQGEAYDEDEEGRGVHMQTCQTH